jgi:hypothetical protein
MSFCILTLIMSPGVPTKPPHAPDTAAKDMLAAIDTFLPSFDNCCFEI